MKGLWPFSKLLPQKKSNGKRAQKSGGYYNSPGGDRETK